MGTGAAGRQAVSMHTASSQFRRVAVLPLAKPSAVDRPVVRRFLIVDTSRTAAPGGRPRARARR